MSDLAEQELQCLRLIADVSKTLLARYPFDSDEEMKPRWRALAQWLATLYSIQDKQKAKA